MKGNPHKHFLPKYGSGYIIGIRGWIPIRDIMEDLIEISSINYKSIWKPGVPLDGTCQICITREPVRSPVVNRRMDTFNIDYKELSTLEYTKRPAKIDECRCGMAGVYAVKPEDSQLQRTELHVACQGYFKWIVAGAVALWGHINEHQYGYRAEYAYPISFLEHPTIDAKHLANIYEVELWTLDSLSERLLSIQSSNHYLMSSVPPRRVHTPFLSPPLGPTISPIPMSLSPSPQWKKKWLKWRKLPSGCS